MSAFSSESNRNERKGKETLRLRRAREGPALDVDATRREREVQREREVRTHSSRGGREQQKYTWGVQKLLRSARRKGKAEKRRAKSGKKSDEEEYHFGREIISFCCCRQATATGDRPSVLQLLEPECAANNRQPVIKPFAMRAKFINYENETAAAACRCFHLLKTLHYIVKWVGNWNVANIELCNVSAKAEANEDE